MTPRDVDELSAEERRALERYMVAELTERKRQAERARRRR
jgi:hypothetical protein